MNYNRSITELVKLKKKKKKKKKKLYLKGNLTPRKNVPKFKVFINYNCDWKWKSEENWTQNYIYMYI